ncbi:MAG TPA: MerR family DNA-binding transcriptional regulator [Ktedonobacteraceae bacterium]|nr:MerR family DNA-binding transcriptional regulator [Ktedonobacteraceae bacterium]
MSEFARVAQVSIVTLYYYDQYGLLMPDVVDQETGYRYYTFDQSAIEPSLFRATASSSLNSSR